MKRIAEYLGKVAPGKKNRQSRSFVATAVAEKRPRTNIYDGAASCAIEATLYGGETGCRTVASEGAIACRSALRGFVDRFAKRVACRERSALHRLRCLRQGLSQRHYRASQERSERPQGLRRVRKQGQRRHSAESLRLACIGCGKCQKTCFFRAITLQNNLSDIDAGQMSLMP